MGDNFAMRPAKEQIEEEKAEPVMQAHFIINATQACKEEMEEYDEYTTKSFKQTIELLSQGTAFKFTPVGIMELREQAFGPFEDKKTARFMIPSELDSNGKDWKGNTWTFGILPMIWEAFVDPNFQVPRIYYCKECSNHQTFKGSCSYCKSQGKKFIPTIEIKDWDKEF